MSLLGTLFHSAQFSFFFFFFVCMVTHCFHSRQTALYIADTTTEKLQVCSFYCPHLQYHKQLRPPSTLHLLVIFMTSYFGLTSNAPLSRQNRQFTTSKNFLFAVQLFVVFRARSNRPHPHTSDGYCLNVIKESFSVPTASSSDETLGKGGRGGEGRGGDGVYPTKFCAGLVRSTEARTLLYQTFTELNQKGAPSISLLRKGIPLCTYEF